MDLFGHLQSQFKNPFDETERIESNPFQQAEENSVTSQDETASISQPTPPPPPPSTGADKPTRYAIIDLFWIPNHKLLGTGGEIHQNEAGLFTISFNAAYGNLRCEFREINQNSIRDNCIIKQNCPRQAIFNIYPEEALNILQWISQVNKGGPKKYDIIERILFDSSDWVPTKTHLSYIEENNVRGIRIISGNYFFDLILPNHIKMFMKSLEFNTSGLNWVACISQIKPVIE